ncbi:MAG: hypothetical protein IKJ75_06545 [Clostridia bacterium]|nr:hypothetical protein [Clostridia bacterium]
MHTDTIEKCAYLFKNPPINRLDLQLVNTGKAVSYYNVYLSDTYLVDFLWKYYVNNRNKNPESHTSEQSEDDYIQRVFSYSLSSFGKVPDYNLFRDSGVSLNPVEHRLATILVYYIQNPASTLKNAVLMQIFEYYRSLILTKMGFFSKLLFTCCLYL